MKHAILTSIIGGMLLGAATEVHAEQTWVNGVTQDSGWIDFDKTHADDQLADNDNLLCWAASASCILDYWQSLYITSSSVPTGKGIWQRYNEASASMTGNPVLGIQWWIGGNYGDESADRGYYSIPTNRCAIQTDINQFGGYYWNAIPGTNEEKIEHLGNFLSYSAYNNVDFSTAIINQLSIAPISLGIVGESLSGHSITLWGVEYTEDADGNPTISSMWITDSDDYTNEIVEIGTYHKEGDNKIYLDYYFLQGVYIAEIISVNIAESDTWALQRIPEPVTSTLSIAALVALLSRRRRR